MYVTIYRCSHCGWVDNQELWCPKESCDGGMMEPVLFLVIKESQDQR